MMLVCCAVLCCAILVFSLVYSCNFFYCHQVEPLPAAKPSSFKHSFHYLDHHSSSVHSKQWSDVSQQRQQFAVYRVALSSRVQYLRSSQTIPSSLPVSQMLTVSHLAIKERTSSAHHFLLFNTLTQKKRRSKLYQPNPTHIGSHQQNHQKTNRVANSSIKRNQDFTLVQLGQETSA